MKVCLSRLWKEEDGVLSFEWVLLLTLLVIGIVSGVAAARDAIVDELGDVAQAMLAVDQSYRVSFPLNVDVHAPSTTAASDSGFVDGADFATAEALAEHLEFTLNRPVALIDGAQRAIKTIAWCSGGAQSYFEAAIAAGADAFITGEISEPQAHLARECGVAFLACGHHASERYGAPAVAAHVAAQCGLLHEFIDIDNPA